jgi:RNA polymerase sigma factor FliA
VTEAEVKAFELKELWRRYKNEGDDGARERLVVAYSPLVKFVAGRTGARLPSHVEQSDLISYGMVGLIEAMDNFEPERRIRFETFAMQRIRGAIIDELRSLDWVPRSVRARARDIEDANSKLENELGRTPTDAELAERLKMSEDELQEALMQIANSSILALEELWMTPDASGDKVSLLDTIEDERAPDPQAALDSSELKDRLGEAVQDLPERETLVIALYYFENLTLREIGEVLGVTESRVSQLHSKAVLRLRSRLKNPA